MSSLPPAFTASALYDTLLQGALRQFFARATFETEAIPSVSSAGRLAIEPTADPTVLVVRWFGSRHVLRVPARRPFTPHEVRLARAIGSVLAARYRALFDTSLVVERSDLFQGFIEDRYVGAFLNEGVYRAEGREGRPDRLAMAIDVLRVAALSSYENRAISSGVLVLDCETDPARPVQQMPGRARFYSTALTGIKSFYRLCDGVRTLFLVNRDGLLLDIVDINRWASETQPARQVAMAGAQTYLGHARATLDTGHVCIVLSPSHEIKVFAEGVHVFTFRNASWQLLDLKAKYEAWAAAVGHPELAARLFQSALNLADERRGALFVVLRDPATAIPQLLAPGDRLDSLGDERHGGQPSRRELFYLLRDRTATGLDSPVLEALATTDGATVVSATGKLLAVGAILLHPPGPDEPVWVADGARTTAAMFACRFGPVLKVSEDGIITFFDRERIWDI